MESALAGAAPRWTLQGVIGHVLLIAVVFLGAQLAGILVLVLVRTAADPGFELDAFLAQVDRDGGVIVAATWASTLICVPLIAWLAKRREGSPWKVLALRPVSVRACAAWSAAIIVLVAATDLSMTWLDEAIVPDFQRQWYSSGSPQLFFLTIVVAAPLFEELFFRGYLMSAIERVGMPMTVGAILSAGLWAVIHVQYEAFYLAILFVMGLLLAAARIRTGSVLPCLAMHAAANLIAFAETAYVVAEAA